MAYSKNLSNNHDASMGVTGWTVVNVVEEAGQFKLGAAAASMYQTRDVSTLGFRVKGFKINVKFTRLAISGSIVDFAYLRVNYAVGYTIAQIPLRGVGTNEVEYNFAVEGIATSITIGVDKPSTSTIYIEELSYYHEDNPFTYEVAEVDKPDNSIITDAYGIHIYDGNAFEGGTLRVSLGEYSADEFGLLIKGKNAETVINEYGINPKFLDYSKNLIWNSSFEVFNAALKPLFWYSNGDVECSRASTFYSDRSLRLGPGAEVVQNWSARVKPWWIDNQAVRVSMYAKFPYQFKVRVVDIGSWEDTGGFFKRYYPILDNDDNVIGTPIFGDDGDGTEVTFTGSVGWEDSRLTFKFNSGHYLSEPPPSVHDLTAFALEIENIDTGSVYIDGVMAHVDFTGQWAQLYKDGPRSTPLQAVGNFYTNPDPLSGEESIFLDGVPATDVKLYDDGMVLTLIDGTTTGYDFTLDGLGNITKITNTTTGIETVIDEVGGPKP